MGGGTDLLPGDGVARRANQVRTALIEATKQLLVGAPSGVSGGFGIGDVTHEAGVARAAFHDHFTDLDQLIATAYEGVHRDLTDRIAVAVADSPDATTSLIRAMVVMMRFGTVHPLDARLLLADGTDRNDPAHPANRELTRALDAGLAAGEFALRDVADGIVVARAIADVGLTRLLELGHEAQGVRDLTAGVCAALARAVGVDADRIDALVHDAIERFMPQDTGRRPVRGRRSGDR